MNYFTQIVSRACAATILGLAIVFCVIGSLAETNTNAARPTTDLGRPCRTIRSGHSTESGLLNCPNASWRFRVPYPDAQAN